MREGLQLPNGWAPARLEELVDILDGQRKPINAKERATRIGSIPYYGATGRAGWIDDFLFDEEILLLGEDGAPFLDPLKPKVYMVAGKSWVNNHAHVLRGRLGVSNAFLMYQMNTLDYAPYVSGTTRLKLPQGPMREIPLSIAPAAEQHRIVAAIEEHLTNLDAAVAILRRVLANLDRYRSSFLNAVVHGLMIDGPAVFKAGRPAASGIEILQELDCQIPLPTRATREHAAADVEPLWVLPRDWCWTTVDAIADVLLGRQRAPQFLTGQFSKPYLRVANIKDDRIDLSDIKEMDFDDAHFAKYSLKEGDILVSEGQSVELVGQSAIYRGGIAELCFQKTLHRVRAYDGGPSPEYMQLVFRAYLHTGVFQRFASLTVNIAHLTLERLKALPFPLPPRRDQERIVAESAMVLSKLERLESQVTIELKRAIRLRQSILKRAFEGKLVPQDPNDEPASVLLDRIRAERAAEVKPVRGAKKSAPRAKRAARR